MPCILDVVCHPRDKASSYQPITLTEVNEDIIKQGAVEDDEYTKIFQRVAAAGDIYAPDEAPTQTSDGSTARYYQLPAGATELQHLISYRDMNAQIGEIFRACYRYGIASHSDKLRDAKKIRFYAEAEIARLEKQV
jgi:hypothetical protein